MRDTEGPGFESHVQDCGSAMLRSPMLSLNGRPMFSGFSWWSSIDLFMISIKTDVLVV